MRQGKIQTKLRIVIEGELAALLTEMLAFTRAAKADGKVRSMALLVNQQGATLTKQVLRNRFDDARTPAGV